MDYISQTQAATNRIAQFIANLGEAADSSHDLCMLRAVYPERFRQLMCTHLSHLIDFPADILLDIQPTEKRRRRSPFRRRSIERSRDRSSSRERDQWKKGRDLEEKIVKLIDYIYRNDKFFCIEGIFRLSGSISRQRDLESLIYSSSVGIIEFSQHSPVDLTCTLKKLLQDRTSPLLTQTLSPYFLQLGRPISAPENSLEATLVRAKRLKAARLLIQMLPKQNRQILQRLLRLVNKIINSPRTRMCTISMARILAPCLLASTSWSADQLRQQLPELENATCLLFEHSESVFQVPVSFLRDVSLNLSLARRRMPTNESDTETSMTEDEIEDDDVVVNVRFCSSPRSGEEIAIESLTDLAEHVQKSDQNKVQRRSSGKRLCDFFKSVVDKETVRNDISPRHMTLTEKKSKASLSATRVCPTLGSPLCTRSVTDLNQTPKKSFGFRFMRTTTPLRSELSLNSVTPLKALPLR